MEERERSLKEGEEEMMWYNICLIYLFKFISLKNFLCFFFLQNYQKHHENFSITKNFGWPKFPLLIRQQSLVSHIRCMFSDWLIRNAWNQHFLISFSSEQGSITILKSENNGRTEYTPQVRKYKKFKSWYFLSHK